MSLTVHSNQKTHPQLKNPTKTFLIGDDRNLKCFLENAIVHKVTACGDELKHIIKTITEIPFVESSHVTWFGVHALFTAHNLELL